jgi:hypothetical protein
MYLLKNLNKLTLYNKSKDRNKWGMFTGTWQGQKWLHTFNDAQSLAINCGLSGRSNTSVVRFEVLTVVKMILFFWVVASCRLVGTLPAFRRENSLQLLPTRWRQFAVWYLPTSPHGVTTQNIVTATSVVYYVNYRLLTVSLLLIQRESRPTGQCHWTSTVLWDFKFSRLRVWSSESSGMYCRVLNLMSGDRPDDRGSTYTWNVGRHSIKNTAVHPRRLWTSVKSYFSKSHLKITDRLSLGFSRKLDKYGWETD